MKRLSGAADQVTPSRDRDSRAHGPFAEFGEAPAIRAEGLAKTYRARGGKVHAVRGIDLEVAKGMFFGLLGPNGAGKSTTVGMLTTLVVPTGGRAWIGGWDVAADPVGVKRIIGVVPQRNTLDRMLTVSENLEFRARFFGARTGEARRRAGELLDLVGLANRSKALAYQVSGGQARRLMIARALVHQPAVLFLDEPTSGLDPEARISLQLMLRELHTAGQTILLTTHQIDEAEELCDRVAVIDAGAVLACGTVQDLKGQSHADTVITVTYDGASPRGLSDLAGRPGISKVEIDPGRVRVFAREADGLLGELVAVGAAEGCAVRDATQLKPSLETVFLALTGREYRNGTQRAAGRSRQG